MISSFASDSGSSVYSQPTEKISSRSTQSQQHQITSHNGGNVPADGNCGLTKDFTSAELETINILGTASRMYKGEPTTLLLQEDKEVHSVLAVLYYLGKLQQISNLQRKGG